MTYTCEICSKEKDEKDNPPEECIECQKDPICPDCMSDDEDTCKNCAGREPCYECNKLVLDEKLKQCDECNQEFCSKCINNHKCEVNRKIRKKK